MDFTKGAIKIVVEATIAEGTGLAYHPDICPDMQCGYAVTHLASGRKVYYDRYPLKEGTVQAWIKRLVLLADWTQSTQGIREQHQQTPLLMKAIDAALDEALEECPGDYVLTTRGCITSGCYNWVTYDHFPYCSECGGDTDDSIPDDVKEEVSA